jgi:hypothetical protein
MEISYRRENFDNMLLSTLESNPEFVGVYSVWKLGLIDGGNPI